MISKLPGAATTIFTVMSKMAQDEGAINLSQGFPDFDGPAALRDRICWHMNHGHNQYAPLAGVPELREQIAAKVAELYGREADPASEITVTPGATEALYCAITAVVHPGDEVIVFDPAYDTYDPAVTLNGGICRHLPMAYPDFKIDWQQVRDAVNDRTRLIILNTPHNPSGTCLAENDFAELRDIVRERQIYLLSDEVYEHIVFDQKPHLSLLSDAELSERSFVVFSFGKTFHATGWRVGYCVAPKALMSEFLKIHQFINFSTNTPMQYGLADFMRAEPGFCRELPGFYQQKRDEFINLMAKSRFQMQPAAGSFFQLADYSAISAEPDSEFAIRLTREAKVAVIPISVFYENPPDQKVVRFCFAKNAATLSQAAERLLKL
ncbi:MAG: methionine aminotransferase [Xanthomonadales bacterium]|nr:methionine aminotransferase [Xanthomonadales bacterium]